MKKQDKQPLKSDAPQPDKTPTRPNKQPAKEPSYAPQQPDISRPDVGTPTSIPQRASK